MTPEQIKKRKRWVEEQAGDSFAALREEGLALWIDGDESHDVAASLSLQGIDYTEQELPYIGGSGGCATVLRYTSARTGQQVEALVVPTRYDVDSFGVRSYHFVDRALPTDDQAAMCQLVSRCEAATKDHYDTRERLFAQYDNRGGA